MDNIRKTAQTRRFEKSIDRLRKEFPDYDPLVALCRVAHGYTTLIDPVMKIPVVHPVSVEESLKAHKEIASYCYPKPRYNENDDQGRGVNLNTLVPPESLSMLVATLLGPSLTPKELPHTVLDGQTES